MGVMASTHSAKNQHDPAASIEELLRVGDGFRLADVDCEGTPGFDGGKKKGRKALAKHAGEIFTRSGDGHLVLITCSDFNGTVYLSNSVVYAVPVSDGTEPAGLE